jgi:threonine synthase
MTQAGVFVCTSCGQSHPINTGDWLCGCGGLFDFKTRRAFDRDLVDDKAAGLWRYRPFLPLEPTWEGITLGEGGTPLLCVDWAGRPVRFKFESLAPTGSFKDRGASVLLTALRGLGVERVVDDSSGNAGASLAAYCARAGIACEVCVPDTTAGPKLRQMEAYGAGVIEIRGRREYATLAAWAAAAHGAYYASHVYNPFFLAGIETLAFELWEQLGNQAPAAVLAPVGNGTLLLGIYLGFRRLRQAGAIDQLPRLLGVQAAGCAPLYEAFREGRMDPEAVQPCFTSASGIAVSQPARGRQILAAVKDTAGCLVTVSDDAIAQSQGQLSRSGFHVEPTSAAAVAAIDLIAGAVAPEDVLVVILTGHGLKTV